jgi:hypothetical protein
VLVSKITTTMWLGRGTAARFFGVGRGTVAVGLFGAGSSIVLVAVGSAATTVGARPLEGAGAAADDGSATAQAADANSNIPAAVQPDRGKACTWNPFQTEAVAEHHSMQGMPPRATRRASGHGA